MLLLHSWDVFLRLQTGPAGGDNDSEWPDPEHPEGGRGSRDEQVDRGGAVSRVQHPVYGGVLHGDSPAARGQAQGEGRIAEQF